MIEQVEHVFRDEDLSDHGMMDYILDMWQQLNVCYRARLEFLASLVCSQELLTARGLYSRLESESADLGDFWAATCEIYKLIAVKERKFGNFTEI